ncbi:unnamed protein product [Phytophthora fragariaefolia]|uniref:Unnamed protein product n=1 Tax=Phytophthora fragariaefolia TaxID=1490495 RepID=A0A9W6Y362_9STRA|nr:unnamed protein product [Phytophthora fragariaefolia]
MKPHEPSAEGPGSSEVGAAEETVTAEVELTIENGQLTDTEIKQWQHDSKWARKLQRDGKYLGQQIVTKDGLVYMLGNDKALRVVLPVALRAKALREAHDSIYSGLLRTPQTFARVAQIYWWPGMRTQVKLWVPNCRDCGTRKTRPTAGIPPLRSQCIGAVGDRWALDVAGPLPVTADGNRYVIAATDYASRYAVAVATPAHTAVDIAKFIMERIVLVYGPMREVVMDGAPELDGAMIKELVKLLQARQTTPVPYRPMLLALVERFHKIWKDMVSMYVNEGQNDWDRWVPSAPGDTGWRMVGVSPSPRGAHEQGDRVSKVSGAERSIASRTVLQQECEEQRAAPNRRPGVDSEAAQRQGGHQACTSVDRSGKDRQRRGFDNWRVTRLDTREELVVHCGFLLSYHYPPGQKETVADRILAELAEDETGIEVEREPTENLSRQEEGGNAAGRPGPAEPRSTAMATTNGDWTQQQRLERTMGKEVGRVPPPGARQALPVGVSSRTAQKAPSRKRRRGAAADQEEARRAEEQQQKKRRAGDEARAARAARRGDAREDRVPTATGTNGVPTTSGNICSSIGGSPTGVGPLEERPDQEAEGCDTVPMVSGVAQGNEPRAGGAAGALRGRGPTREEPTGSPLLQTATRGATLFDQGKIEDDLLAGDGVWTERSLTAEGTRVGRVETDDGDD